MSSYIEEPSPADASGKPGGVGLCLGVYVHARRAPRNPGYDGEDVVSNEKSIQAVLSRRIGNQAVRDSVTCGYRALPRALDIGFANSDGESGHILWSGAAGSGVRCCSPSCAFRQVLEQGAYIR